MTPPPQLVLDPPELVLIPPQLLLDPPLIGTCKTRFWTFRVFPRRWVVFHSSCVPSYRNYTAAWWSYPYVLKGEIRAPKSAVCRFSKLSPSCHGMVLQHLYVFTAIAKIKIPHRPHAPLKHGFDIKMNENPMVAAKADYWDLDFPKSCISKCSMHFVRPRCSVLPGAIVLTASLHGLRKCLYDGF